MVAVSNPAVRLLERIAGASARRPWRALALAAALAASAIGLASARLELRTSNLDLVDADLPAVRAFRELALEFGTPNVLVVALEGDDEAALEQAVRRLGPELRRVDGARSVLDRLDYDADTLADAGLEEFFTTYDRRMFFVLVQPDDPLARADTIAPFVAGARRAIETSRVEEELGVSVGLTGLPQYALDDREHVRADLARLTPLSALLVLAVFAVGFVSVRRPVLAMVALGFGVAWTLGFAALWPGHLTLLSAFSCSILFGLGVDYGIHVVARAEELSAEGAAEADAARGAVGSVAPGLWTGAATTAAAFFALLASGLRGFAELGAIAGAGVLLCLLSAVSVLPALLVLTGRRCARARRKGPDWAAAIGGSRWQWLAAALVAAAVLSPWVARPRFDEDYLALQPRGSEAVRLERAMVERSDLSPQFAVFVADDREEARRLAARLLDEDVVGEVHSIADLEDLRDAEGRPLPVPADWRAGLESKAGRFAVYAYPSGDAWDPAQRDRFLERMRALDPGVTGMPVLGQFLVRRSQDAMVRALWLGGFALVVCVALDLRRPGPVALALLPTILTLCSMPLLLRAFRIALDPISVMALPVVLGVVVDDGVHLVHRFRAERGDIARTLRGSGRSVTLTSLTTMVAFGSLALARHRGLAAFGGVTAIGVAAGLAFSLVVLPVALTRFGGRRGVGPEVERRAARLPGAIALVLCAAGGSLAGAVPAAGADRAPLLDPRSDRELRHAFLPSERNVHGELRLVRRGDAWVLQTLLYTHQLRRGVQRMRRKELYAWPEEQPGREDSQRYLADLERAADRAIERARAAPPKADVESSLQTLLIELVLDRRDALWAFYDVELAGDGARRRVVARTPFLVGEASRVYLRRAFEVQAAAGFDLAPPELAELPR
jgi:predicted RND superfamily exporter protein